MVEQKRVTFVQSRATCKYRIPEDTGIQEFGRWLGGGCCSWRTRGCQGREGAGAAAQGEGRPAGRDCRSQGVPGRNCECWQAQPACRVALPWAMLWCGKNHSHVCSFTVSAELHTSTARSGCTVHAMPGMCMCLAHAGVWCAFLAPIAEHARVCGLLSPAACYRSCKGVSAISGGAWRLCSWTSAMTGGPRRVPTRASAMPSRPRPVPSRANWMPPPLVCTPPVMWTWRWRGGG